MLSYLSRLQLRLSHKQTACIAKIYKRSLTSAADLKFGQPIHETHPHLIQRGELTPGILAQEYADRRQQLARLLPENSVAIFSAADLKYQTKSVFAPYHQDPDFFYLTGFNEPEALAIIEKPGNASDSEHVFHLLVRPKDETAELWEGARSGMQAAQDVFNADEAGNVDQAHKILPKTMESAKHIFAHAPSTNYPASPLSRFLYKAELSALNDVPQFLKEHNAKSLRHLMNQLRAIKSDAEVKNMRKAGQYSGNAFTDLMSMKAISESDVATALEYRLRMQGCERSAYVPVIAGGERNALCIHYVRNDETLRDGQLLLVDAAGEYGGYKSDITRTWPVNSNFSDAQKDLYEVVLGVQRKCVSLCQSNAKVSLDRLHAIAERNLSDGLRQIGFDINADTMHLLCPHHVGHHVGLDVHDIPGYPRTTTLQNGNCITIEPGVYVPNDDRWPVHFRGIGIRIEDSVCVDDEEPYVLTTEAVKERVDIEAVRKRMF